MKNHLLGFCSRDERLGACSLLSKPALCQRPMRTWTTAIRKAAAETHSGAWILSGPLEVPSVRRHLLKG